MTPDPRRLFITGTDTGVGKTIVTAALMAAAQARGLRALPVKPVQTGCPPDDDLAWCLSFSALPISGEDRRDLALYRFPLPASPHLAAARAGRPIKMDIILAALGRLEKRWDLLIIEGAGGLLAPLNETETMVDMMMAAAAAPVVVARSGLGTLNHTALTLNELERRQIKPAALVINDIQPAHDPVAVEIREDNLRRITRMAAPVPVAQMTSLPVFSNETLTGAGRELFERIWPGL